MRLLSFDFAPFGSESQGRRQDRLYVVTLNDRARKTTDLRPKTRDQTPERRNYEIRNCENGK